jgi:hypothetical protein
MMPFEGIILRPSWTNAEPAHEPTHDHSHHRRRLLAASGTAITAILNFERGDLL